MYIITNSSLCCFVIPVVSAIIASVELLFILFFYYYFIFLVFTIWEVTGNWGLVRDTKILFKIVKV